MLCIKWFGGLRLATTATVFSECLCECELRYSVGEFVSRLETAIIESLRASECASTDVIFRCIRPQRKS